MPVQVQHAPSVQVQHAPSVQVQHAPSLDSPTRPKSGGWRRPFSRLLPVCFAAFVICLLGQYTLQNDVQTFFLDDSYYEQIVTALRVHPTEYYSIAVAFYHQLYAPTLAIIHFPLIFYIWILVPNNGDVKWLYFGFALASTGASYWAVESMTKQKLLAILSASWIAYFLETSYYFMFEYWAIAVFLVGLAFFVSERHASAAMMIGLASLIKEVFAPFMVIASIYYLLPLVLLHLRMKMGLGGSSNQGKRESRLRIVKKAIVWCVASSIVGLAYYMNGVASQGTESPVHFFRTFDPSLLPALFSDSWFQYPPIPVIVTVSLALIGISVLAHRDQRVILYVSFASMILLMLTAGGEGLISTWEEIQQSSPRYIAMSVALVNLFWIVGLYRIAQYILRWLTALQLRQRKYQF